MRIEQILEHIEGQHLTSDISSNFEFKFAFSSDLMSDVLTLNIGEVLLITGLNTIQAIRTAYMADIHCVILSRNKKPSEEMIKLAKELDIHLIQSAYSSYRISGLLFNNQLQAVY